MRYLIAVAILLSFFVAPAEAKTHRHHGHHWHHAAVHKASTRHWQGHRHRVHVQVSEGWGGLSAPPSGLVAAAERYLGGNPTGWAHNWCSQFLNAVVLPAAGLRGTGDARAISFAHWGVPSGPEPGAIAVMSHHVGIVMADHGATVTLISGNHGHRVAIGDYPRVRILAFRGAS